MGTISERQRSQAPQTHWLLLSLLLPGLVLVGPTALAQDNEDPAPYPDTAVTADPATASVEFIDALLARMTLTEKLGQLTQGLGGAGDTGPEAVARTESSIARGETGSFLGITGAARTRRLQRIAVEESRLGIPLLFAYDVIHGLRTIYPMPLAEAASWNLEKIEASARLAAIEATAHGVHWTFAPMVDVTRDPRWGRIVEGAGEDPFLASAIAAARVRGFQGDDLAAPDTLLATAKHFVAYGAAEGGRDYDMADISERTLFETYLPPFEAAVNAGVATVMASFNEINGMPAHANRPLLQHLLREELGFDGVIISDYNGVPELIAHGVATSGEEAARLALGASLDMEMVSSLFATQLPAAIDAGRVDEATIDVATRRVLQLKQALGLFEDPYRYNDTGRERRLTLDATHREASRAIAEESIVLLKNDNDVLPLDAGGAVQRIAVVGPLADDPRSVLGGWAMQGRAQEATSILDGLREAMADKVALEFVAGTDVRGTDTSGIAIAVEAAARADVVILVVGESWNMSSEANNRVSLNLPGVQSELARAVVATGTPVVAVLVNGRPLSVAWLDEHADAILETWFLGNEAGHVVADVLGGAVNPSGKLPVTFPRSVGQVPIYFGTRNSGRPHDPASHYTQRYIDSPFTPLYPFGYGLSYTRFDYSDIAVDRDILGVDDTLSVSATITNTGDVTGTEVVQLYTSDPVASVTRPLRELKGFERVKLAPGESRRVVFTLTAEQLAFRDAGFDKVAEAGEFMAHISPSSVGGLTAHFALDAEWRP